MYDETMPPIESEADTSAASSTEPVVMNTSVCVLNQASLLQRNVSGLQAASDHEDDDHSTHSSSSTAAVSSSGSRSG